MNNSFDFSTNTLIIGGGPEGSTLARKLSKIILIISLFKNNDAKKWFFCGFDVFVIFKEKISRKMFGILGRKCKTY